MRKWTGSAEIVKLTGATWDLFLGAHGGCYGMEAQHALLGKSDTNLSIDPEGYFRYVTEREGGRAEWEKQKKAQ